MYFPIDAVIARGETRDMPTAYDEVQYPSAVYSQTHPDRLATIALLSGMEPTPVERCRVLELGSGDGFNLLAMSVGLPESEFVGIDLAEQPIARGNAIAARIGQKNVRLIARDVAEDCSDLGQFDYIIAHGLFSWVPQHVRERVMKMCRTNLSPGGVAYISYNAYPGNHMRDLVRGMMRYHVAHFDNPTVQILQARGLIKLLSEAGSPTDPYLQILARELDRVRKYTDSGFFHDDLSSINQPFYFHQFMTHAQQNGLQFLGEADICEKQELTYPAHVQAVLQGLDSNDVVGREQYRDFLRCRAFRQTLLCHEGIPIDRELSPEPMRRLFLSGELRSSSPRPDITGNTPELFTGCKKAELETSRPLIKVAFRRLGAAWPAPLPFNDLLSQSRSDLARNGEDRLAEDAHELSSAMLGASIAGAVELRAHNPHLVMKPGEKPRASALARAQVEIGNRVATLLHGIVQIDDEPSRILLRLLDGTRDRAALRVAIQNTVPNGRALSEADLDEGLGQLARMALIES